MIRPSTSPITLTFGYHAGYPLHNGVHQGVDFAYLPDAQIYAPASGKVTVRPLNGDDGNAIYMTTGNQLHGFCHLKSFNVRDGQLVNKGDVLGIMGDTGAAEGRHLHWAVKVNGSFVDPLTLVNEQGVVDMITKEQEQVLSLMQTGSYPGKDYNYQFTGQPLTQENLDAMLQFWSSMPRPAAPANDEFEEVTVYVKKK